MAELHDLVAHWFKERRGIRRATVEAFGVYTDGTDVVFPYPEGLLKRRYSVAKDENPFGLDKEGRRFVWRDQDGGPAGAGQVPYLPPDFAQTERMILIPEGETDTMAAWQALQAAGFGDRISVVGLSGVGSWKDKYAEELFGQATRVFVVLDNDDPYENPDAVKSVEGGWQRIRDSLGRKARRVKLPQGTTDLAEFFMAYDWAAFEQLLIEAAQPRMNYPRLDLSKDPGPVDWLLTGMVAKPDVTVLYGDGGVSKSMLLQGLAVAVAEEWGEYMGVELNAAGRVLFVDEENPEDVVLSRMKKLGLTKKGWENLYYVWHGNVSLDEEPERLYADVMEFEPALLCLDSFSRLNTLDESSSSDINRIFKRGLAPISRKLKVPIIALHHVTKEGRIRGSVQIRNAADLAMEVVPAMQGKQQLVDTYTMFPDKPRRGQKLSVTYRVVGYDAVGEVTEDVDAEARIAIEAQAPAEEAF